jgi:predicted unusual protein kinase regulating ubiquinone biosynthesis (AarF/ABC1/UbiB family)
MWFPGIQDLLAATLEIPFSVPPYMALLARSVATLEGIALTGDPSYQMVAQVCFLSSFSSHSSSDDLDLELSHAGPRVRVQILVLPSAASRLCSALLGGVRLEMMFASLLFSNCM